MAEKIKAGAETVDGVMEKVEGITDNETVHKITDGIQNVAGKVGENADKIAAGIAKVKDSGIIDKVKDSGIMKKLSSWSPWKGKGKHNFRLLRFSKSNKAKLIR